MRIKKTILVIDDSPSLRGLVKMALSGAGYYVIEATDGQQALHVMDGRMINLIVCDLNMPRMNGIDFAQSKKSMSQYKYTNILMLSSDVSMASKKAGQDVGVRAWMGKPFNVTTLIKAVDTLCKL